MNISGTLNVFRLIRDPTLCLPHHTVSTFNHLPVPLSKAFATRDGEKGVDIRAVVLDKDNCFAIPHKNEVYTSYNVLNGFCSNRIRLLFKSYVIFQHSSSCYSISFFMTVEKQETTSADSTFEGQIPRAAQSLPRLTAAHCVQYGRHTL
jgi:hypothetical protein